MSNTPFFTTHTRWQAVCKRNRQARGHFYYAVKTTGIFCHPDCPSRMPNKDNTVFFNTMTEALKNGYRPCKRCRPNQLKNSHIQTIITQACRQIEHANTAPTLTQLAHQAHLSIFHFQRLFKKTLGITPKQYAQIQRSKRLKANLKTSRCSVTDAIYQAGYQSASRVYDNESNRLAMSPSAFKKGAAGVDIVYGIGHCFIGKVLVAATKRGVCSIEFGANKSILLAALHKNFPDAVIKQGDLGFSVLVKQVVRFIDKPYIHLDIPLDIQGSAFQQQVWQTLRDIKVGEVLSYTQVAERIGKPSAIRAVASACAANKLAVMIPCHRVVNKNGTISGYRWGIERKQKLQANEAKTRRKKQ